MGQEIKIGIAHDYFSVERDGKEVQIPIIFMPQIVATLQHSPWCKPDHALSKNYGYEVSYGITVLINGKTKLTAEKNQCSTCGHEVSGFKIIQEPLQAEVAKRCLCPECGN